MRPISAGSSATLSSLYGRLQFERAVPLAAGPVLAAKVMAMLVFAALAPIVLTLLAGVTGRVMFDVVQWVSRLVLALLGVISPASLISGW